MKRFALVAVAVLALSIGLARWLNPELPSYAGRDARDWAELTPEERARVDFDVEDDAAATVARWLMTSGEPAHRLAALRLAYQGTFLHHLERPRHRRLWLELLRRAVEDLDAEVRATGGAWLCEHERSDAVLAALAEVVRRDGRTAPLHVAQDEDPTWTLGQAFRVLTEERERGREALPVLRELRDHASPLVREAAVAARWSIGDPDAEAEIAEAVLARVEDEALLDLPKLVAGDEEVRERVVAAWERAAAESDDAVRRFIATRAIIAAAGVARAEAPLLRMLDRDGLPARIPWAESRAFRGTSRLVAAALASRAARDETEPIGFVDPIAGYPETRDVYRRDPADGDVFDDLAAHEHGRAAVEAWAAGHRERRPEAARKLVERFEEAVARRR